MMFSMLAPTNAKKKAAEQKLFALVRKSIAEPEINTSQLLENIKKLVSEGADLNTQVSILNDSTSPNKKTFTYHLLMHIPDFAFAQQIFDLGGDPRILNIDQTNLFMHSPKGRGIFTQVCWLDYINSNFDFKPRSEAYGNVILSALFIYYFCTMKEIQALHKFTWKNITEEGLKIYNKIHYNKKYMTNTDFEEIQKIQKTYLFYSSFFGKLPATMKTEMTPIHDKKTEKSDKNSHTPVQQNVETHYSLSF